MTRFGGDPITKHRVRWFGSAGIPLTFVLTPDLAEYLAAAVDVPGVEGQRIDIGWGRPISMQEFADIAERLTGEEIRVQSVPVKGVQAAGALLGPFNSMVQSTAAMMGWFQTGKYVADTTRQAEVFGAPPTAEDAVRRLIVSLGHALRS
ncbi:hypothetical protein [Pseudarthrobacter siccitolerans]|uniref:hypothetical protein n=1 Tax=Pseudarthrobacter siccitolerans TaxID=861266 RepID=UPI0027BA9E4A|nr:hypothetical protein [Pseudarthrobacter siccitolerans]